MKKILSYISLTLLIIFSCVGCSEEENVSQSIEKVNENTNFEKNSEEISKEEMTEKKVTADDVEMLIKQALNEGLTSETITKVDNMYSKLNAAEKEQVSSYSKYQDALKKYKVKSFTTKITSCVDNVTGFEYSIDEFDDSISIMTKIGWTSQNVSSDGYMFMQAPSISVYFSDSGEPDVMLVLFWTYASTNFLDAYALRDEELILLGADSLRVKLKLEYVDSDYDDLNITNFAININDTNSDSIVDVINSGTVVARLNAVNNQGVLPQATLDAECKKYIVDAIKLYEDILATI